MSGYSGGHILRIKVTNFMTYDELEIFPRHGLNLIIGLNGSGKSSIMCAICLGLAGKPQYTGRSSQLSDFVKYGCDKATIEIELDQVSKRNLVITRIIQNEKSTWMINGSVVSLNEVQQSVKKFNIDVSNLCQFLPQEKVTAFSKMNKKERLENMLKAIGEPWLFNLFEELKQLKVDSLKQEEERLRRQQMKDAEDQTNKRLKVDVDKQEEKQRLKENLNTLSQYKLILQYNEIRASLESLKSTIKPLQVEVAKAKAEFQAISSKKDKKYSYFQKAFEDMKNKKNSLALFQGKMIAKEAELCELDDKVHNAKIHYQNRLEERRNQFSKLNEIETQLRALRDLCSKNSGQRAALEEKSNTISSNLNEIKNHLSSLTSKVAHLNLEKNKREYSLKNIEAEIRKMKSEENKKLEVLRHKFPDAYTAVQWLKENKHRFKAGVYPPMLLLLKVSMDDHRKYIENLVKTRDLIAFLCEDKEDNKLLTNILRVNKNLNVNIVMVPDKPIESYSSLRLDQNLRNVGVQCFIKDVVEAPDPVMRFLCQVYGLHRIPLCISSAERNRDVILTKFSMFFTPDARITGKHSKYGDRNFCIRRDPIKATNLLPGSKDNTDQLKKLEALYQKEKYELESYISAINEVQAEIIEYEQKENSYREARKSINEQLMNFTNAERQFQLKKQSYEKKKNDIIDQEQEKLKVQTLVQNINLQKMQIFSDFHDLLKLFLGVKKEKLQCNLKARIIYKQMDKIKKDFESSKVQQKQLEVKLEELTKKRTEKKECGSALYAKIQEFLPSEESKQINKKNIKSDKRNCVPPRTSKLLAISGDSANLQYNNFENDENLPPVSLKEKFAKLNNTLEEVTVEIRRIQAQLDLNCEEDESVLDEYRQRKNKIAEIQKEVEHYDQSIKRIQDEMLKKKNQWLPALQNHIQNINSKFSQYYKQLKCAGEISLDTCNNTDDFPKYGLQITLKYRDSEPFMELSNTHHSGGECSVAAIIFILSLQELTEVPFRCIDEINQGMDSQNERNIYNLIADSAKSGSCSQYFLLTPKLLMDLEMIAHRDVAVHVIYNSIFLETKLDVEKHIKVAGNN